MEPDEEADHALKPNYRTWRALASDCIWIMFVTGTIGIALKFTTFFDKRVYFPSFPNILDSTFLILAMLYLSWRILRRRSTPPSQR
jgi:hypothetical protein